MSNVESNPQTKFDSKLTIKICQEIVSKVTLQNQLTERDYGATAMTQIEIN